MHLSPDQIRWILIDVFVLVISVALHEFGHAIMADRLGDDTPRRQGRVTLNPIAHADVLGTLIVPVVCGAVTAAGGAIGGFGWGKPVEWQPSHVTRKVRMATAQILVAVAGPAMNVLLAVVVAGVHTILLKEHVVTPGSAIDQILFFTVGTNFVLFFFNLVPAPPLDGGHVLEGLMPYRHRRKFEEYARFGPFVVLAVVVIPQLAQVFLIPAGFCTTHLYHLFGM